MDTPISEAPEPGRLAALLPASLGLTTLARQASRVGPSFVVALGAAGLAGPVLAALTKKTAPGGARAHHHWFLAGSSASEARSGPGRDRRASVGTPGLGKKAAELGWRPLASGGRRGLSVCVCVVTGCVQIRPCACVHLEHERQ